MSSKRPSDPTGVNTRYYDLNAQEYFQRTSDLDLSGLYEPFLTHLERGARILDAGCGPGRDLKAFAELGFDVVGMDASESMVRLARAHSAAEVHHVRFQDVTWRDEFDGVWACASLLHVPRVDLAEVLALLAGALKPGGVLYASFKLGSGEREANGREFTDLDAEGLDLLLAVVESLAPVGTWVTQDVRTGRGLDEWLNAVLRKNKQ